ncbi:DNA-directed DNA polymerase [Halobellus limi]|uniref:DNA-directed DNA polymerase n=1 Tax=Halobellus limi TaxID=699433 RepID=A0A1H5ZD85_9EURY|nr:DNA-directed DNA polymerase [Halobellus limi]QCC48133.1 hypothetical protein DV707_10920 [Halobellus limi]SEG34368.1 DNA polymerase I [Halobellus limi]
MTTQLHVTNIDIGWDSNRNEVLLNVYGISNRGEHAEQESVAVYGFLPYFYVETAEAKERETDLIRTDGVRDVEHGFKSIYGDDTSKITVNRTKLVRELSDSFDRSFDADVRLENRFRIDLGIYSGIEYEGRRVHYSEITPIDLEGEPRILNFDIETDDRGAFPELGEKRILSIVAHDSWTDEYVGFIDLGGRPVDEVLPGGKPAGLTRLNYYPTERDMLRSFAEYVHEVDCDLITGWNIERFDAPYLLKRMKKKGVDSRRLSRSGYAKVHTGGRNGALALIGGRTVYDMLHAYKRTQRSELPSYRLDAIAEREVGEQKLDHTGEGIYEMWINDADKLLRYNYHDVRLVNEINDAVGVIQFNNSLRMDVGVDFDMTSANHNFIEMLVRRELFARNVCAPTVDFDGGSDEKYTGAHVVDPFYGLARNVVGMDLASLYPYTMAQINASPEVRVEVDIDSLEWNVDTGEAFAQIDGERVPVSVAPNGTAFRLDQEGVFTSLVSEAIDLKAEWKEKKHAADPASEEYEKISVTYDVRKTIVNSAYGVMGWVFFFLYDEPTAEAVTTMGQEVIKATQTFIDEESVGEVVYGDTDSNYVQFPESWDREAVIAAAKEISVDLNEMVYPELAKEWGMGQRECLWDLEVESYAKTFFQAGKKKRYAMWVTWSDGHETDKTKIVGFDTNRSDTAQLTNDLMKEVLVAIIKEADKSEITALVSEYADRVGTSPVEYIGIPQGIKRVLSSYGVKTEAIRGAENANRIMNTNFSAGSKPMRVRIHPAYFDQTGTIDVLSFDDPEELPEEIRVDVTEMTEKLVTKPMGRILPAVDIDVNAAISGQTQGSLSAWA